jgi:GNAT superfamily N-acetyltransferase
MPKRLTIREVRAAADPAFTAAHQLFRRVFPRAELLPKQEWEYAMRERAAGLWTDLAWHMLVAERGRKLLGAASGSYLGNINVGIIGYIAVEPRTRSRGIGPQLRRRLRLAFERDARRVHGRPLKALVGEVRLDNPWLRHLVRRDGAVALDFPYYQPSLHRSAKPVPLVLYYQPLGAHRSALPATDVRRLLYTMWRRPYRIARPLSRPLFRRMLKALEGRRTIGQRPLPSPARRAPRVVS